MSYQYYDPIIAIIMQRISITFKEYSELQTTLAKDIGQETPLDYFLR